MFKPLAIKEITNPKQEKVVRVGADDIHTVRRNGSIDINFVGSCLVLRCIDNRGRGLPIRRRYLPYYNSIGGTFSSLGFLYFGYAILRSGSSLEISDNYDGDIFLQYPEQ